MLNYSSSLFHCRWGRSGCVLSSDSSQKLSIPSSAVRKWVPVSDEAASVMLDAVTSFSRLTLLDYLHTCLSRITGCCIKKKKLNNNDFKNVLVDAIIIEISID